MKTERFTVPSVTILSNHENALLRLIVTSLGLLAHSAFTFLVFCTFLCVYHCLCYQNKFFFNVLSVSLNYYFLIIN